MISIVSTYKNRRHHIEKVLPSWQNQIGLTKYEIIIVDYDSDDDILDLVSGSSVLLVYVKCKKAPIFHLSHARNVGVNHASGDNILFIDIDTILSSNAIESINDQIQEKDDIYLSAINSQIRKEIVNGGLIVVHKNSHVNICGFNENLCGWGYEDIDYKKRLEEHLVCHIIPSELYVCIDHSDDERTQCYSEEKEISWTKNRQIALKRWTSKKIGHWDDIEVSRYGKLYGLR